MVPIMKHIPARGSIPHANPQPQQLWPLDQIITRLSIRNDQLRFSDQVRSVAISGDPMSGKTSTMLESLAESSWALNHCGVVFCVKRDSAKRMIRIAKAIGHAHRIRHMRMERDKIPEFRFDPVKWNMAFARKSAGGIPARAGTDAMNSMLEVLYRGQVEAKQDNFFGPSGENMAHKNIRQLMLAGGGFTMDKLLEACRVMPDGPAAFDHPEKYPVLRGLQQMHDAGKWSLELAELLSFYKQHAGLSPETRTSIEISETTRLNPLMEDPIKSVMFDGDSTITPEMVDEQNLIWIVDFPVVDFGNSGRAISAAVLEACITYGMSRPDSDRTRPFGLWLDEGFAVATDKLVEAVERGRSARLYSCITYQNIHTAINGMGGNKEKAMGLLGSIGIHGWFSQSDYDTREWAQKKVGQVECWVPNVGDPVQAGGDLKWGLSLQYQWALPEEKMGDLKTGRNTEYAECYLYDGRHFNWGKRRVFHIGERRDRFLLTRWYRPLGKRWRWWELVRERHATAMPWMALPAWYLRWVEMRDRAVSIYGFVKGVLHGTR
jgi:hypothetical protein